MSKFQDRIDAAPAHVAYFTRGGGRALITQTMGTVIAEGPEGITVESAAIPNGQQRGATIVIPWADLIARKDDGQRITPAEWDQIFLARGHEQA